MLAFCETYYFTKYYQAFTKKEDIQIMITQKLIWFQLADIENLKMIPIARGAQELLLFVQEADGT